MIFGIKKLVMLRSVKNAGDIRDQEFVLPEKVGQSSPKIFTTP